MALRNQYQEALSGQFPKGVVVKTLVRNEKGSAVLDITSIPVRQASQVVRRRRRVLAYVKGAGGVRALLEHLGLPPASEHLAPARGPPQSAGC